MHKGPLQADHWLDVIGVKHLTATRLLLATFGKMLDLVSNWVVPCDLVEVLAIHYLLCFLTHSASQIGKCVFDDSSRAYRLAQKDQVGVHNSGVELSFLGIKSAWIVSSTSCPWSLAVQRCWTWWISGGRRPHSIADSRRAWVDVKAGHQSPVSSLRHGSTVIVWLRHLTASRFIHAALVFATNWWSPSKLWGTNWPTEHHKSLRSQYLKRVSDRRKWD